MPGKTKSSPPLIKLHLAIPFIEELEARGLDSEAVFTAMDLTREQMNSEETFVSAVVMYTLLEKVAEVANDPFIGVTVGENLDIHAWPVFTSALDEAGSAGEFFIRFIAKSRELASSVEYHLEVKGDRAVFYVNRTFQPSIIPAQTDSFYVGLFANIFSHLLKNVWDLQAVIIKLSDPQVVPGRYCSARISRGDLYGFSMEFPGDTIALSACC